MTEARWYVAMAKPGRIFKAKDELIAKGFEVYVPIEKWYRRINGRRFKVEQPLLGRYMFVLIDSEDEERIEAAHHSAEVDTLLPHDRKTKVPAETKMVEAIRDLELGGLFDKTSKARDFDVGEKVRLISGPFLGALAQITQRRGNRRWGLLVHGLFAGPATVAEADMELAEEERAA